jgi:hypothetical protein
MLRHRKAYSERGARILRETTAPERFRLAAYIIASSVLPYCVAGRSIANISRERPLRTLTWPNPLDSLSLFKHPLRLWLRNECSGRASIAPHATRIGPGSSPRSCCQAASNRIARVLLEYAVSRYRSLVHSYRAPLSRAKSAENDMLRSYL